MKSNLNMVIEVNIVIDIRHLKKLPSNINPKVVKIVDIIIDIRL
jgi:hypothetical protein